MSCMNYDNFGRSEFNNNSATDKFQDLADNQLKIKPRTLENDIEKLKMRINKQTELNLS